LKSGYNISIEVDGNVSYRNIPGILESGGEILVLGTSSLFTKSIPLGDSFRAVKNFIEKASVKI